MTDQHSNPLPPPPPPSAAKPSPNTPPSASVPPPATYIVQLPREQILRYPPPENAKRMAELSREDRRRSCCCLTLCLVSVLIVLAALAAGVMYLVFNFRDPEYTVNAVAVRGLNLTSPSPISPAIAVSILAENPSGRVGIYYLKGSAASVSYGGVELSNGALPAFYQPRRNVTVIRATLASSGVEPGGAVMTSLRNAQRRRRVPLAVKVEAPIRFKVGSAKTWEMMMKLRCDVVLDALTDKAQILAKKCVHSVRLW